MLEALIGRNVGGEAIASYEARLDMEKERIIVYDDVQDTVVASWPAEMRACSYRLRTARRRPRPR